jgi:hypothetical protein
LWSARGQLQLDDAKQINSATCGLTFRQTKPVFKARRFVDAAQADQNEWGWHVMLVRADEKIKSGTLINSQWVLTIASKAE